LQIAGPYNGGATFMAFLADEFGEDIHARLLHSSAKTFDEALANETKPYSLAQSDGIELSGQIQFVKTG
jgi:hypothetical protein